MAGKKYSDEIKEKARAFLSANDNLLEASRKLHIPKSTLGTWKKQWETEKGSDSFGNLRTIRRTEFINKSWNLLEKILEKADIGINNLNLEDMTSNDINALTNAVSKLYQVHAQAKETDEGNTMPAKLEISFIDAGKNDNSEN